MIQILVQASGTSLWMLYGPNHPKVLDAASLMVDAFNQVHSVCRTQETRHSCQLSLQDRVI